MLDVYDKMKASNHPLVMGILNATPDSFSDGGKYLSLVNALKHAEYLIECGADIIDIGGESTRPGSEKVSDNEELKRVIPIIVELKKRFSESVISIDSTKSVVVKEAITAGAEIINDISGGTFDSKMLDIVAESNLPFVIMHIQGIPKNMQDSPFYMNVTLEVTEYLANRIKEIKSKGITKIIIDPGIGFGKRVEDNYSLLNNLKSLKNLNYPILIGVSKKSFLGNSLNLELDCRENSTTIAETIAAINGANIIRTHNVKNAVELKNIIINLNKSITQVYD